MEMSLTAGCPPRSAAKPARRAAIRYRTAQMRDLDALVRLEEACFPGNAMARRQIRRHILNPLAHFWVAVDTDKDRVTGYSLVLHHLRRGPRLYSIAVALRYRREGIGRTLLKKSLAATQASGAARIILEVKKTSRKARSLYSRAGFSIWKTAPDYYGAGIDAVKMVKIFR